jgi:2-polyprenyl-3-methyl-5-hydroxy-6-metoxy-1,4-benzoquinol methylase
MNQAKRTHNLLTIVCPTSPPPIAVPENPAEETTRHDSQTHCTFSKTMNQAIMNPNKALWEKGDFTGIAALMRQSGEAVVKALGITPLRRVLDLGCGDGTTAVPMARMGAEVGGIDIARNLVDAGNKRAAEAGLTRLTFQEGDACNLQEVGVHSFDLALKR